jgi:hypothetical protein
MGERSYTVSRWDGENSIQFSESDDSWGCLCTFPHNDDSVLTMNRLRSLALLGAAVILVRSDYFKKDKDVYLPDDMPVWIVKGIDKLLNWKEEE